MTKSNKRLVKKEINKCLVIFDCGAECLYDSEQEAREKYKGLDISTYIVAYVPLHGVYLIEEEVKNDTVV